MTRATTDRATTDGAITDTDPGGNVGTAEATSAQHAVWFTERAGVAGTAYHMALGVRFAAAPDRTALAAACAAVLARHPVLGTRVAVEDGAPTLAPTGDRPPLLVGQLTEGRIAEEIARRWDLDTGPLSRFTLLVGADGHSLLLFTAHHLVFDGMSKDVLVRELAAGYNAALAGRPATPNPTPIGYADHAAAERDRIATESPAAHAHWTRHQSGSPGPTPPGRSGSPGLVLPGLSRVPADAEPGATVEVGVDADLANGLDTARHAIGVTRFELLLAVVLAMLDRYGNAETSVGVGLSTRTAATADHIGLFVNELPVSAPAPTGTFRDHALAVRARVRQQYSFRAVPLAHVVSGLRPAPALTPVSVGYRRRGPEPTFTGVATEIEWALFSGSARNALHIQMVDGPGGLSISLQYPPAALPTEAAERIGAHLITMLRAAVEDPSRAVADLPVLPVAEWDLVVRQWNATDRAYPAEARVPDLFAARVRADPDRPAVVDGDRTLSYAELDAATAKLAGLLRGRGVGTGSLVGLVLDRSWQAVAAMLAVLRCGAGYVPVDPTHPAARQALVLADADPVLVVTTAGTAARLDPRLATLHLDRLTDFDRLTGPDRPTDLDRVTGPVAPGAALPWATPDPDDLAYLLYTSGSTGRPKGVAVPHGALANLLLAMRDLLGAAPEHRWLHLTSPAFDISGVEILLPLVTGGRVVVASAVSALDGAGVLKLIESAGVTHVQATPSGWRVLLEAGLGASAPTSLVAVAGGEALPVPLARDLRSRVARLVNGYGPTEATIYATAADVPESPDEVTIGGPLANYRAYILDGAGRPAPIGVPGELHLGGRGLAAGYHGQPDLTADRFVPDPFTGPPGRLYRTGDRCRWRADGRIEFLGRADDQVKIRGHRVELGEITAQLREHPGVADAAVTPYVPDESDEVRLVGYLVPRGAAPEPADLRAHLARSLPTAILPTDWVVLDRLPLSPNGKLDRAALPAPVAAGPAGEPAPAESADPVVEELRQIWQDVLQIPEIGPHEDLFDLGGHSLTITRISGRIQRRLGVEVPLDAFFDTPTIAEIAEIIRQSGRGL
nr:amino acid adenylation domain-containing protein [Micromonospora sp. DSM 115978]